MPLKMSEPIEGPTVEVIQTCDQCRFLGFRYRCYHADAPSGNRLQLSESGNETYTPDWCPIGKHEMVAVRKSDLLDRAEMQETLDMLVQWDSEHGRGPESTVISKLESILKRMEGQ